MSNPFLVGEKYQTQDGESVTVVSEMYAHTAYWCIEGSDGIWRYNRESDRGRVTASNFDMSCPQNLVPRGAQ